VIQADTLVFPNNVVDAVAIRFGGIDSDLRVFRRPLRHTDPSQSIGVLAAMWEPDEDSQEMLGKTVAQPTVDRYICAVQAFVKDINEERGLARHSVLSELVRTTLYGDPTLHVWLRSLQTDILGVRKRLLKWGIRRQTYVSNEIDENFLYLSTLEFEVETEMFSAHE
jgi:hypothetical protein